MKYLKSLGLALFLTGVVALMIGGFEYSRDSHEAKIGSLVISVRDTQSLNVPIWVGVGGMVLGSILFVTGINSKTI